MSPRLNFVVTDAQHHWLRDQATREGVTMTDYVKARLGMNDSLAGRVQDLEDKVRMLEAQTYGTD